LQEASGAGVVVGCSGALVGASVVAGEEVAVTSVAAGVSVGAAVGGTAVGSIVSVGLTAGVVSMAGAAVGGITVAGAVVAVSGGAAGTPSDAHPRRSIRSRMIPRTTATIVLKRS
jgi:hypothetical protein